MVTSKPAELRSWRRRESVYKASGGSRVAYGVGGEEHQRMDEDAGPDSCCELGCLSSDSSARKHRDLRSRYQLEQG